MIPERDNSGHPTKEYVDRLAAMTENELRRECNSMIWLSAYASGNHRSDYHWKCDATYDECKKRRKKSIYSQEYRKLLKEASE
jgi:hypothetical protein